MSVAVLFSLRVRVQHVQNFCNAVAVKYTLYLERTLLVAVLEKYRNKGSIFI